jgi:hypothetical protein
LEDHADQIVAIEDWTQEAEEKLFQSLGAASKEVLTLHLLDTDKVETS